MKGLSVTFRGAVLTSLRTCFPSASWSKRHISIGMKQLQRHPWDSVLDKYKVGDRVRGTVTRVTDFGAFVELEPGVEGLIHVSEMSWVKKVRKPSDLVKPGLMPHTA